MALTAPAAPATKTIKYSNLLGCDYSQEASLIDRTHSPDMINMISDEGGNPVKRKGWERLLEMDANFINVFREECDKEHVIVEVARNPSDNVYETAVCEVDMSSGILTEFFDVSTTKANTKIIQCVFSSDKKIFIFASDGWHTLTEDAQGVLTHSELDPFIPLTVISRPPSGLGGVPYQNVNLLTPQRTEQFLVESATDTFIVASTANTSKALKVEVLEGTGWTTKTASFVNSKTVKTSASVSPTPIAGQDNVRITYYSTISNVSKLRGHNLYAQFKAGIGENIFLGGGDNKIYYSAVNMPEYFPDINYIQINSGKVMGFLNVMNELAVVTTRGGDSTINVIYDKQISSEDVSTLDGDSSATQSVSENVFAIRSIPCSNGAISSKGFAVLGDEPLFLSNEGIMGIVSLDTTEDRVARNRSRSVNRMLTKEPTLKNAQMFVLNDYLYLISNKFCYVFDGRHKTGDSNNNTNYYYEAYKWEISGINGFKKMFLYNEQIYFLNGNNICRFKNTGNKYDYSDGSHWDEDLQRQVDGVPIHARWTTKNDDDGSPQMFKTMLKKGSMVTLQPYEKSSVTVYARPDGKQIQYLIGTYHCGQWQGFEEVDFSSFTFDTADGPKDYFFRKKRKKYVRLQLIFENNEVDEGFGIQQVIKTVTDTRYAK